MDSQADARVECDICQKPCSSKKDLEIHVRNHVKRLKHGRNPVEEKSVCFYLGANSFGQISSLSSLVCWSPVLLTENLNSVICNLSSVAWIDDQRQLQLCGFREGVGKIDLTVQIPQKIKFNSITYAFRSICGITDDGIYGLSAKDEWEFIKNRALRRICDAKETIRRVATCRNTVYCLTGKGQIFNLMEEDEMQVKIPGTVFSFDCGEEHCIAATEEKEVYSWGSSLKGQLGRGTLQDEPLPERIPALGGLNIIQIACGKWHNVALTSEGDLYVWGWNKHGQLGLPCPDIKDLQTIESSVTVQAEPVLLDFQIGVRRIACGSAHTLVLADDSTVWGCGLSKFGQLGKQNCNEKEDKLVPIRLPEGKVSDIIASDWSSIFLFGK
ncbi:Hypothetical predicted protein [Cloeon dipterum]|uniref:C2H2-type domain-containing protein n=1 Tax=Cloeon dipterum TaxID=197152 RepID=A0A8S1BYW8_9INSE|nr:Hypothetical predicted protein [Cloeon dipterum]